MSTSEQRRPYVCPGCRREYRIPAAAPDPGLCPACEAALDAPLVPVASPDSTATGLPRWMAWLPAISLGLSLAAGFVALFVWAVLGLLSALMLVSVAGTAAAVLGGLALSIPSLRRGRGAWLAGFGVFSGLCSIFGAWAMLSAMQSTSALDQLLQQGLPGGNQPLPDLGGLRGLLDELRELRNIR